MEFSSAPPNQTGGLQIGTEPFAVLLIGAVEADEIDEVARRKIGFSLGSAATRLK
jgi:hypothetical protein